MEGAGWGVEGAAGLQGAVSAAAGWGAEGVEASAMVAGCRPAHGAGGHGCIRHS